MKKRMKKLVLSRETVHHLTAPDLRRAMGALLTVNPPCPDSDGCPPPGSDPCDPTCACELS
jgi:hypothetical protein